MTIKAIFDGKVFIPQSPVNLPTGSVVDVAIQPNPTDKPLMGLLQALQAIPENPDWPTDGAAQLDHYLYGMPKKP